LGLGSGHLIQRVVVDIAKRGSTAVLTFVALSRAKDMQCMALPACLVEQDPMFGRWGQAAAGQDASSE